MSSLDSASQAARLQALETASRAALRRPCTALPLCTLQGGATAAIPGVVLVNDCTGPDYSQTSGVAACSYIRVRLQWAERHGMTTGGRKQLWRSACGGAGSRAP